MTNDTCSVDGCDRRRKSRGWCQSHYMYWYSTGTVPTEPIRGWGQNRVATCQVDGCDLPYDSRGYCAPHRKRVDKYGHPGAAAIRPRTIPDEHATYQLIHERLRKQNGSASQHPCVRCGDQARHWAYDHAAPDERIDFELGFPFSVDLRHYQPMCVSCHKRYDEPFANQRQRDAMGRYAAYLGEN